MNSDELKRAIGSIKAGNEFKENTIRMMKNKSALEKRTGRYFGRIAAFAAFFLVIAAAANHFIRSSPRMNGRSAFGGADKICDMFIYNGSLYYTGINNKLYIYDNKTEKGRSVGKINISEGGRIFENNGYVYFSSGKAIYRRDMTGGGTVKLLSGEYLSIDGANGNSLFYSISYRDPKDGGFTEFEHHVYDLSTDKDTVLLPRSENMWHFLAVDGGTIIADANLKDDYGLFAIDALSGDYKKLSSDRAVEGIIIDGMFYYLTYDEKGLYSIQSVSINGGDPQEIQPVETEGRRLMFDSITGYGRTLYIGAYYYNGNRSSGYDEGSGHILSYNLDTHEVKTLAKVDGSRIWELCTDGKILYAYSSSFPLDKDAEVTVIEIK